jgi:hypothetical protein
VCEFYTSGAEGFSSLLHRAEIGHHHHVDGRLTGPLSAQESAWREDHRRVANDSQIRPVIGLAMWA